MYLYAHPSGRGTFSLARMHAVLVSAAVLRWCETAEAFAIRWGQGSPKGQTEGQEAICKEAREAAITDQRLSCEHLCTFVIPPLSGRRPGPDFVKRDARGCGIKEGGETRREKQGLPSASTTINE